MRIKMRNCLYRGNSVSFFWRFHTIEQSNESAKGTTESSFHTDWGLASKTGTKQKVSYRNAKGDLSSSKSSPFGLPSLSCRNQELRHMRQKTDSAWKKTQPVIPSSRTSVRMEIEWLTSDKWNIFLRKNGGSYPTLTIFSFLASQSQISNL